jgi:CheY-like chemotaxis protein
LLADDSVTIQRVIELTFADENIQVIAVGDGQQAIQRIEADKPDVVLADVGMPERDGYEVAAHVKGSPHLAHIPVVLLTGAFEPIDEARARAVGCDGVLVKPFEPQMVINRVKDLLAGRRPASLWATAPGQPPGGAQPPRRDASTGLGVAPSVSRGEPPRVSSPEPAAGRKDGSPQQAVESLDEYFDRLDSAFSQFDGAAPPAAAPPAAAESLEPPPARAPEAPPPVDVDFGEWDIGIDRRAMPGPSRVERTAVAASPSASTHAGPGHAPAPVPPAASHAEPPPAASRVELPAPAEASVLSGVIAPAAPSGRAEPPALADAFAALLAAEQTAPRAVAPGGALSDELIEEVVRRVMQRLTDRTVRDTVLALAEKLIREEIDRLKKGAH